MRLRVRDEDGVAMVTVLLITFVLLIVVAGTMSYAVGSMGISRRDQDWNAALAAAEAGVDDYLFRLNQNVQYYLYSATSLPPGETTTTSAFTNWRNVPNAPSGTSFRYTPNIASLASEGAIVLTSTGRAKNVARTIQTTLRRQSFIDYQYFTDYETNDPATYTGNPFTPAEAEVACAKYYYGGRDSDCNNIFFTSVDDLNGPVHSNDAIAMNGDPNFASTVSTSWNTTGQRWWGSGSPTFQPGNPAYHAPLTMPPSNVALKADADSTLGGTGCLYTGPTAITLNSVGTMTVVSPGTISTNANCVGTGKPLPPNGVIYVQTVPADSSDPNYYGPCRTATQLEGTTTISHPLGYPQRYDDVTDYDCKAGDVFVKGTLKGRLTIAAENNIDIIGNLTYSTGTGGTDLLGLVANNYVEIYHPVTNTAPSGDQDGNQVNGYWNLDLPGASTAFHDPTINAAILSVAHSFRVVNHKVGDNNLGNISIVGAIAQKYRGPVGNLSGTGYGKDYNYDQRLKYQSPPRFLNPIAAAWQIVTWIERPSACASTYGIATTGCP